MAASYLWKLVLAVALGGAIVLSASIRAPRKPLRPADLRWLALGVLALYGVGLVALLKHHGEVAALLFAGGIAASTLAFWLSRGIDAGGWPPRNDRPVDEDPPEDPGSGPEFDWPQFERELHAYVERSRDPVGTS